MSDVLSCVADERSEIRPAPYHLEQVEICSAEATIDVGRTNVKNIQLAKADTQSRLDSLIEAASKMVSNLNWRVKKLGPQTRQTLQSIYQLHVALEEDPIAGADFFRRNDIEADPRTKYPAQPIIRHLVAKGDPALKAISSHWAGAIAWAKRNDISPDDFVGFIKRTEGGIRGAYDAEVKASLSLPERIKQVDAIEQLKTIYRKRHAPVDIPSSHFLKHADPGMHLAFVKKNPDGTQSMIGILDKDVPWVETAFDKHVSRVVGNQE